MRDDTQGQETCTYLEVDADLRVVLNTLGRRMPKNMHRNRNGMYGSVKIFNNS
jgi:hypothetical protein